ncbi:MAG TPA: ATP-dependent Clp protease adapter ClpS [Acidimicrobiales bacterium]|nr:ATP-dependent Clp protease adapter ClpS [Acidimicrobiales bacterium]
MGYPVRRRIGLRGRWRPGAAMDPESRVSGAVPAETVPLGELETTEEGAVATDKPWLVIVWNDPINLMSYVTFVFQKLFGYSKAKATALMMDVHTKGRAVVSSGTRERAELDCYRLHEHGLWATMEQSL